MIVKFKLLDGGKLPTKGTEYAACFDVYARKIGHNGDGLVICYLGFMTEIPVGYKGVLITRSNITKHSWVMANSFGIIDSDFRNEWQMRFRMIPTIKVNNSVQGWQFPYKEGERVGQIYFEKVLDVEFEIVNELNETERGLGGFGSTGIK